MINIEVFANVEIEICSARTRTRSLQESGHQFDPEKCGRIDESQVELGYHAGCHHDLEGFDRTKL